ncbi:MAG: DUF6152 family protein [Gammaproteobacteria bacterium]|nr:DUF6152 family protein [Gammaproteobacteria bacterium]
MISTIHNRDFILKIILAVAIYALTIITQPAESHHSFAQRMAGELQSVEIFDGYIDLYRLLNPHSALIVNVITEQDEIDGWLIELSSASTLRREGWHETFLQSGERVSIAILASTTPNRGRLRALLVHGKTSEEVSRLIVAYGIRGDTPIMNRLQERLSRCPGIEPRLNRGECFIVNSEALNKLEDEFPGKMGYIMP